MLAKHWEPPDPPKLLVSARRVAAELDVPPWKANEICWCLDRRFYAPGQAHFRVTRASLDALEAPDDAASDRGPTQTLHRYAWAYDERALDVLGSVFTADAVFDGVVADQDLVGPIRGRQQIVDWLEQAMLSQGDQRRHCIVNTLTLSRSATAADLQS